MIVVQKRPSKQGRAKQISKRSMVWLWRAFAVASTIIGISGIPGDLDTWSKWIDIVVNDPLVLKLAAYAVAIADFVNQPWVRTALVIGGVLMFFWPVRWFWRLRHRLVFWGKRALDQEVWVGRDTALDLVRKSRWAYSRERLAEKPRDRFGWAALSMQTDPARDERSAMFYNWCMLALDQYAEDHDDAVRKSEKGQEFSESKLRKWLDDRFKGDLRAEFGEPY